MTAFTMQPRPFFFLSDFAGRFISEGRLPRSLSKRRPSEAPAAERWGAV